MTRSCIHSKMKFWSAASVVDENVGNKAKGQISKRVFHEGKARQNFRKTNVSYPLRADPKTRVSRRQSTPNFPKNKHFLPPKGGSQNGCFKKAKHAKFSKKQTFLIP